MSQLLPDTKDNCNLTLVHTRTNYLFYRPVAYESISLDTKYNEKVIQKYKSIGIGNGKRSEFPI